MLGRVLLVLLALCVSVASARATDFYADRTALIVSPDTGTLVIYFAKKGDDAFLWSPDSKTVLSGRFRTKPKNDLFANKMCFTFGPEKLNPINGVKGGKGECLSIAPLQSDLIVEQIDGDVFGLKTCSTPPFALQRGKTTLKAIGAKAHVKFASEVIITENLIVRPGEDATAADIDAILNGAKFVNPDTSTIVPPLCRD